jgi:hypothetical protein
MPPKRHTQQPKSTRAAKKQRRAQKQEPASEPVVAEARDAQVVPAKPEAPVGQVETSAPAQVWQFSLPAWRRFSQPVAPIQPVAPPAAPKSRARRGAQAAPATPDERVVAPAFWNLDAFWTFLAALLKYAFYAALAWTLFQGAASATASVSHGLALLRQACLPSTPARAQPIPRVPEPGLETIDSLSDMVSVYPKF